MFVTVVSTCVGLTLGMGLPLVYTTSSGCKMKAASVSVPVKAFEGSLGAEDPPLHAHQEE